MRISGIYLHAMVGSLWEVVGPKVSRYLGLVLIRLAGGVVVPRAAVPLGPSVSAIVQGSLSQIAPRSIS